MSKPRRAHRWGFRLRNMRSACGGPHTTRLLCEPDEQPSWAQRFCPLPPLCGCPADLKRFRSASTCVTISLFQRSVLVQVVHLLTQTLLLTLRVTADSCKYLSLVPPLPNCDLRLMNCAHRKGVNRRLAQLQQAGGPPTDRRLRHLTRLSKSLFKKPTKSR